METRYIVKKFAQTDPLQFNENIYVSNPVKRISIECFSNSAIGDCFFMLLESNMTPERFNGLVISGAASDTTSRYEYIFQNPKTFQGEYKYALYDPSAINLNNTSINNYVLKLSPDNDYFIGMKITFEYA